MKPAKILKTAERVNRVAKRIGILPTLADHRRALDQLRMRTLQGSSGRQQVDRMILGNIKAKASQIQRPETLAAISKSRPFEAAWHRWWRSNQQSVMNLQGKKSFKQTLKLLRQAEQLAKTQDHFQQMAHWWEDAFDAIVNTPKPDVLHAEQAAFHAIFCLEQAGNFSGTIELYKKAKEKKISISSQWQKWFNKNSERLNKIADQQPVLFFKELEKSEKIAVLRHDFILLYRQWEFLSGFFLRELKTNAKPSAYLLSAWQKAHEYAQKARDFTAANRIKRSASQYGFEMGP